MVVIENGNRYEAQAGYEDRHVLKKARWRWDPDGKVWWTDYQGPGLRALEELVEVEVMQDLIPEVDIPQNWEGHPSAALDGPTDIPCPPDLAYMPFQRGGIAFGRGRAGVLVGDDMGLGKTVQAIGMMNDEPVERVLILCPASLKLNWEREVDKWLNYWLPVTVIEGKGRRIPQGKAVVILNYDILKHYEELREGEWDVLVCDEAQYLKNPEAKRTRYVLGDVRHTGIEAKRRVFLSGTPLESRPVELWPVIHSLWPEVFPSYTKFILRYCAARKTPYGWDTRGASNLAELQGLLRTSGMVRRKKRDVLKDLPGKMVREVSFPPPNAKTKKLLEKQKAQWTAIQHEMKRLREAGAAPDDVLAATQAARGKLQELARETSAAKMPMALEFLSDSCEQGKVVVFAKHHVVLDEISKKFGDQAVRVDGKVSGERRQEAVDRFQTDPECRLFIGQIEAAGVGLTLTAASHVVFIEYDWRPGKIMQAEDRCDRIGQKSLVIVSRLVLEGSLDQIQLASLGRKEKTLAATLDV